MSKSSDEVKVRKSVREAMDRLLEGNPMRSDGKMTIKSLAVEANVKRWVLTQQHTDLQAEFRLRCKQQRNTPENQRDFLDKYESMKKKLEIYKIRVANLTEENHRLTRIVHVLTLENTKFQEQLENRPDKVSPIR